MSEFVPMGSIGASNTELSHYTLNSEELIEMVMRRLRGEYKFRLADGTEVIKKIEGATPYNERSLAWMQGKLEEILNKNMALSDLTVDEMYAEARYMSIAFCDELFYHAKDFELTVTKMERLRHTYSNLLSQIIRHALGSGIRRFLKETTQETTQRVNQTVTESQEKKGLFGGLFGGRK